MLEATTGVEAIKFGAHHTQTIDLFLSDVAVPDRSGTEVALELIKWHPVLLVLFVSGTPIDGWDRDDVYNLRQIPPDRVDFLEKPFRPSALLSKIEALFGDGAHYRALEERYALEPR